MLILTQYKIQQVFEVNDLGYDRLALLERTGALRLLVSLLDGDLYITQLIKRGEDGIASQPAIEKTRTALAKLDLIEEYEVFVDLIKKTRLYVKLTNKGEKVARNIKKVVLLLSES
jgi:hypothetical protein